MPLPADRRAVKIAGYLDARVRAARLGDRSLVRALTADLARMGYQEPVEGSETAEAAVMPERAGPARRRRREAAPAVVEG